MPWKEVTQVSQRKEFVFLAKGENNFARLCRRFNISRKTGYKWLHRSEQGGSDIWENRSHRTHSCPHITPQAIEEAVLKVRKLHPTWGGRKIHARLKRLGHSQVPAASTITTILKRHGCIDPEEAVKHSPLQRFEAEEPNALWQMDFKGHFSTAQGRCHPLTVLDDHSRYALGLQACANEQTDVVQDHLRNIFRCYGMPRCILADNGAPWGSHEIPAYTPLTVWLLRLGVHVIHGRPHHPQTQGKDERFHRTLKAEVLGYCKDLDLNGCQQRFNQWRSIYNQERPHEALGMQVPAERYHESPRNFPERLPEVEYGPTDTVRKVQAEGWLSYQNRWYRVCKAFRGESVALRPTMIDGVVDVFFCNRKIEQISLTEHD